MPSRFVLLAFCTASSFTLILVGHAMSAESKQTTRPATCAGTWYPGDADTLAALVDKLMDEAKPSSTPAATYKLYDPPEFELLKTADRLLYQAGQKNALDLI